MNNEDIKLILAHHIEANKHYILEPLIMDIIYNSNEGISEEKLYDEIENSLGLLIRSTMLKSVIKKLRKEDKIYKNSKNKYFLDNRTKLAMKKDKYSIDENKRSVFINWIKENELEEYDYNILSEILDAFVRTLFISHSLLGRNLILGDYNVSIDELKSIETRILLEKDKKYSTQYSNLLDNKLVTIFHSPMDKNTFDYLIYNAKSANLYLASVIPNELKENLEIGLKNLILYLDTNVVYRFLGFQGDSRYENIEEVLKYCREKEIKLKISYPTLEELNTLIRSKAKIIEDKKITDECIDLASMVISENSYISKFIKENKENGVKAKDFNSKYKNTDLLLESEGIIVEKDNIIDDNLKKRSELIYDDLSRMTGKAMATVPSLEHDSYNLAYIESKQVKQSNTIVDKGCLFMTTDHTLIKFDDYQNKDDDNFRISILPSQLLQIFSFITPKNEYYKTFVNLFSYNYLSKYNLDLVEEDIFDISSRLSLYDNMDSDLAVKILSNQLLNEKYAELKCEDEKEDLINRVIDEELKKELKLKNAEVKEKDKKLEEKDKKLEEKDKKLEEKDKKLEEKDKKLEEKDKKLEEKNKKLEEKDKKLEEMRQKDKIMYINYRFKKWFALKLVLLLVIIIVAVLFFKYIYPIDIRKKSDIGVLASLIVGLIPIWYYLARPLFSNKIKKTKKENLGDEYEHSNDIN